MEQFLIGIGLPAALIHALKLTTLGRLLLAAILGGSIGLERELKAKPAGLRTTLLICVGAAMFTELSLQIALLATGGGDALRADPARLAAQIIPGIGFIGAGAILHGRGRVTGLTTAATLWVVTAIGIAVGAGAYVEAIGTTVMVLFTLLLLTRFERIIRRRFSNRRYTASVVSDGDTFEDLLKAFERGRLEIRIDQVEKVGNELEISLRATGPAPDHDRLVKHLIDKPTVRRFNRS